MERIIMIECHDLSKQFDTFTAVDGVTLAVQPGEVFALLGQNGAGKTTTIRMLTSVLAPTRGWAKVNGYDTVASPTQVRSSVGVLTEQHGLYPRMTALEYLDFFGEVYGLDADQRKKRSDDLLAYFGLTEAAPRRSGEYSKGMKQKLALARALMHEPPALLLDEPTSAMDPESAQLVRHEIDRLRSADRAIIMCSHNLNEVELLADRIAIIYRGRLLISGTLGELKTKMLGHPEFDLAIAGAWTWNGSLLPDGVKLIEQRPNGIRFQTDDPRSINPLIIQRLMKAGAEIVTLQEVPRDLEKVYLQAMTHVAEGTL
jgi:ABC-2 type transport system ATP-binding protein